MLDLAFDFLVCVLTNDFIYIFLLHIAQAGATYAYIGTDTSYTDKRQDVRSKNSETISV